MTPTETILKAIGDLEADVRADFARNGYSTRAQSLNGHGVEAVASDAMINRGTATGTAVRVTWKVDGSRVAARDLVDRIMS